MGGGATGSGDLVLVIERVGLPRVNGVVFEAGEDCVSQWLEEHLSILKKMLLLIS